MKRARGFGYVIGAGLALGLSVRLLPWAFGEERLPVEASLAAASRDPAHAALTADLVARARAALARAAQLRSSGDEPHARLADGLARELADAAKDLADTVDMEAQAAAAHSGALDAGARSERERALLEEAIARTGRLRAELSEADRVSKEAPPKTNAAGAAAGAASADAGVRLPGPMPPLNLTLGDGGFGGAPGSASAGGKPEAHPRGADGGAP